MTTPKVTEDQVQAGAQALMAAFPTLREDFYLGVVPQGRQDRAGGREVNGLDNLLAQLSSDKKAKGDQFELITKWWLENDPVYKAQFVKVWHFSKWEHRWTNKDLGTDLIAEDVDGKFWAIQAKGYKLGSSITFEDMGTWLADSNRPIISYRLLVTSTNGPGPYANATTVFKGQVDKPVFVVDHHVLEKSDVNWPVSITDLYAVQPEPKTARDYQTDAINAVMDGFAKNDRGQLLMVSASGKTLTGLFIAEKMGSKNTLVLVPSLLLLKQTLKVWRANNTVGFKSKPVGSDATANNFGLDMPVSALGYPATTNAKEIAEFLREDGVKVVFSTYQSSAEIAKAQAMKGVPNFDLVIADEAHNTAGKLDSYFATVLHEEKIKAAKRLFMTATPKNFTPRVLQRAVEIGDEHASMDDAKKYGEVFYELPYVQALKRKLVTDYKIAIIAVTEAELLEWAEAGRHVKINGVDDDLNKLAGQIAVLKAMGKYGMRRVITFHNQVERARIFTQTLPQALDWLSADERPAGTLWAKHIHGEMPMDDRTLLLDQLGGPAEDQFKVLANAKVLTEGVDVPALDGIAILDPKRSAIAIYQAQGRAIRLDHSKPNPADEITYTVLPVFVPSGDDVDDEAILNSSAFEPVWRELLAMRLFDERFAEWVDGFRLEKGKLGTGWKPTLPPMVITNLHEVYGPDFVNALAVKTIDMTTAPWLEMFGRNQEYYKTSGTANAPVGYRTPDDQPLGWWGNSQRFFYRTGKLSAERIAMLESLGDWSWEPRESNWMTWFEQLQQHTGKTEIPRNLARWRGKQRVAYWKGTLSSERIKLLESLGDWSWKPLDDQWKEFANEIQKYFEDNGTTRVRPNYETSGGYPLGKRAAKQRSLYKLGTLSDERIAFLENLGDWSWELRPSRGHRRGSAADAARWMEMFAQLKEHYQVTGSTRGVPKGTLLANWMTNQISFRKKGKLSEERIAMLDSLGDWSRGRHDAQWQKMFDCAEKYYQDNGTVYAPYATHRVLYVWIRKQLRQYSEGKLSADRIEKLENLGDWTWDARS